MSFINLQKKIKNIQAEKPNMSLAVLGDVSTQFLKIALQAIGMDNDIILDVYESQYDVVIQEILDDDSGLYQFNPDNLLLYFSSEKLLDDFYHCPVKERTGFADNWMNSLSSLLNKISVKMKKTNILIYDFIEKDDGIFAGYALKTESSFLYQVRKLNLLLSQEIMKRKNVFIVSLNSLALEKGTENIFSYPLFDASKVSIKPDYLEELAKRTISVLSALRGKIRKGIIVDLDNTLWGGVIGDDGIDGIQIGEHGIGRAFLRLQKYLKEMERRGIVLCVCSKNDIGNAKEPFISHPEMILHLDDFALFVANWEDKATNIRYIQSVLNVSMDSLVFLDDNPFERNLVRTMIPEITVPELPKDPSLYVSYLRNLNLFEVTSISEEDSKRVSQYQAEGKREEAKKSFTSIEDYLKQLKMVSKYSSFKEKNISRISQLSLRSNQFNLRTIRYTESDIKRIINDSNYLTIEFSLNDRFGDSGLISALILKKDENILFIDTWIMSCRVLKRTMESFIINQLVELCREKGITQLVGEYLSTKKNSMVADLYQRMGFIKSEDGLFVLNIRDAK
ncbi:MAG: HAD-IIIC family phosphatase [Bacilli bacterium]